MEPHSLAFQCDTPASVTEHRIRLHRTEGRRAGDSFWDELPTAGPHVNLLGVNASFTPSVSQILL